MIGNVNKGKNFHGLVRYFDPKLNLQGIISVKNRLITENIEDSDFIWKRLGKDIGDGNISIFRSKTRDRMYIVQGFGGYIYDCRNTYSYYFDDCYQITGFPLINVEGCNTIINEEDNDMKRSPSNVPFKYNMLRDELHKFDEPMYPFCKEEISLNRNNIRKSVDAWWKSVSLPDVNPFWFQNYSKEPFQDANDPQIKINLNFFAGRKNLQNKTYHIYSHTKLLHTGRMIGGRIDAKVKTNDIIEWVGPLKILVAKSSKIITFGTKPQEQVDKYFIVDAQLHRSNIDGIVRVLGTLPNDPDDPCEENSSSALGFIGHYKNGIPSGYCWKGLLGGSWIYGKVNNNGMFSSNNITYINQDVLTAFKGTFQNGVMVKAKSVEVIGERCNEEGIKIMEFSPPSEQDYHFERPTSETFGDQPLVVDPLDDKYVRLGESNIDTKEKSQPKNNNGAFANVDIPPKTIIAHNNGYILTNKEHSQLVRTQKEEYEKKKVFYNKQKLNEDIKSDLLNTYSEDRWKYKTQMPCGMTIDIPLEMGQDPTKYSGTRGHKLNHSFANMNTKLTFYDSARFGIVSSIISRDGITIPKGAELFAHYGYSYHLGPRWYKKLFKDFVF